MNKLSWERMASILFCIGAFALILYYGGRFLFPVLLPFLLGALLSLPLRPLSRTLSRRLHLSQKLCAGVLLILFGGLGAWGIGALAWRLLVESGSLAEELLANGSIQNAFEALLAFIEEKAAHLGSHTEGLRDRLFSSLGELLTTLLTSFSASLPGIVSGLFSAFPHLFFVAILSVASGYWFCTDGERIKEGILILLPEGVGRWLHDARARLNGVFRRYLKAYLQLWALTAVLLWFGLLFLRVEYAFFLSLLISTLDLLPVIGVGTVMLPWGIILLLCGDLYRGFGILILYLIVELIRQLAEPKLLGKHLGLHPLLTLFSTYVGFYCYGFLGMILGPVVALLIKSILPKKGSSSL